MLSRIEQDWQIAEALLKDAPNGKKLPYSAVIDSATGELKPRPKHPEYFKEYKTTRSFIKIDGEICMIDKGDEATVGVGQSARVKRAFRKDGSSFLFRIETNPLEAFKHEFSIMKDIGLAYSQIVREPLGDKIKRYTSMPDRGEQLLPILERGQFKDGRPLNDALRLNLAIGICLKLDRLHRGLDSVKRYVHLDLKLENITVKIDEPYLVDMGFAEEDPDAFKYVEKGTADYAPSQVTGITTEQRDFYALKLVLFFTSKIYGRVPKWSVLTQELLRAYSKYELEKHIVVDVVRQSSFLDDKTNARTLAALLISAKLDLGIFHAELAANPHWVLVINKLYEEGQTKESILEFLKDEAKTIRMAARLEMRLDPAMADQLFSDLPITDQQPFEIVCALIALKQHELTKYNPHVISSTETAKAALVWLQYGWDLNRLVSEPNWVRITNTLKEYKCHSKISMLFEHPEIYAVLLKILDNPDLLKVYADLVWADVPTEQLIEICNNEDLGKALAILRENGLPYFPFTRLTANPEGIKAIFAFKANNCHQDVYQVFRYEMKTANLKAINLVAALNIPNKAEVLAQVSIQPKLAKAICFLHDSGLSQLCVSVVANQAKANQLACFYGSDWKMSLKAEQFNTPVVSSLLSHEDSNIAQAIQAALILIHEGVVFRRGSNALAMLLINQLITNVAYGYAPSALARCIIDLEARGLSKYIRLVHEKPKLASPISKFLKEGATKELIVCILENAELSNLIAEKWDINKEKVELAMQLQKEGVSGVSLLSFLIDHPLKCIEWLKSPAFCQLSKDARFVKVAMNLAQYDLLDRLDSIDINTDLEFLQRLSELVNSYVGKEELCRVFDERASQNPKL